MYCPFYKVNFLTEPILYIRCKKEDFYFKGFRFKHMVEPNI